MRPQDMAQIQQVVIGTMATLKGDFDTEIKALKAATAEWDKRANVDKETKRIAADQAALDSAKQSVEYDAKQHEKRLQGMQDDLEKREAKVKAREQASSAKEQALANASSQLDQDRATFQNNVQMVNADLNSKMTEVEQRLSDLKDRDVLVAERESKVKKALAVAGTLVQ